MVDYGEAIKKPFTDPKTLGIGAIIGAIPLVNILVNGYGAKTAQDVTKNKHKLREWKFDDITEYIIKAIFIIIIQFAYTLIPAIIIGLGLGATILPLVETIASGQVDMTTIIGVLMQNILTTGIIVLTGGILLAIVLFLLPAAIIKYLKKDDIKAAFQIGTVIKSALTVDYIITLIIMGVYSGVLSFVVGTIGAIIGLIPFIGVIILLLLAGGVSFVTTTTFYTLMAQVVK